MRPLTIVVILVIVAIAILVTYNVTDDSISIKTKDVDYEATYEIVYTDGTKASIKKYATATVKHDDKTVKHITFDLDAKFQVPHDDVRVNTPRNDPDHETKVTFFADVPDGGKYKVSEYPLSTFTNADFSVLDTGDWYNVFKDIKITTTELDVASQMNLRNKFVLRTVVDIWYNIDPDKKELIHHELIFSIPFKILTAVLVSDDTSGTGGNGDPTGTGTDLSNINFIAGTPITSRTIDSPTSTIRTTWGTSNLDADGNWDWSDWYNLGEA